MRTGGGDECESWSEERGTQQLRLANVILARCIMVPAMSDPVDVEDLEEAAQLGRLAAYLEQHVPREQWGQQLPGTRTPLHVACEWDPSAVVPLLLAGVDVNARTRAGATAMHVAVTNCHAEAVRAMLARGALLLATLIDSTPLDYAIMWNRTPCAHVLLANGARLGSVRGGLASNVTRELRAFERGVLRCRAAVVALLALKRLGCAHVMRGLDRWVVREAAYAVWATREDKAWA